MFCNNILKSIACILIITYCSTAGADLAWAIDLAWSTEQELSEIPLLAQVYTGRKSDQEKALRQQKIYKNKAQRLEKEINKMEGSQELLFNVMVSSAFVGGGLLLGSNELEKTINDIELEPGNTKGEEDKECALDSLQSVEQIGWGIAGVGVLSAIGYVTYSAVTHQKEKEKGELLPDRQESSQAVIEMNKKIDALKNAQRRRSSFQHAFSSVAIGSLLTGGLLWGISGPLHDNISDIEINDNDIAGRRYKDEALDTADEMENWGKGLVIAGAVSGVASIIAGFLADSKEEEIDEFEKGLLRANYQININPKADGFVFMYSYNY
ncbi:MAG: hypothetical protein D3908_00425 [Candidatus Electrothrix sp. AUS4]|nr:hypothetical protein [Candidatus Electrothrix sp. AUS4]